MDFAFLSCASIKKDLNRSLSTMQFLFCLVLAFLPSLLLAKDNRCVWDSYTGATFDLTALMASGNQDSYSIHDGDIPCTPEVENAYFYTFNICGDVTAKSLPSTCTNNGAALQYFMNDCYVIGEYDPLRDEEIWSLYDQSDPSKGVSLKYIGSPNNKCSSGQVMRTLTIDLLCGDKQPYTIDYAQEPDLCQYHIEMVSVYACPKECGVTANGLCDGHGECAYDSTNKKPHCFCYDGHSGADCSKKVNSEYAELSAGGDDDQGASSLQISLMVLMVFVTLGLVGVVVYMIKQVQLFREEQFAADSYSSLVEAEMTTMQEF